jgi:hypothetical protein
VLDIAMTKIRLQGACVMAGVGEGEAAACRSMWGMGLGLHAGARRGASGTTAALAPALAPTKYPDGA